MIVIVVAFVVASMGFAFCAGWGIAEDENSLSPLFLIPAVILFILASTYPLDDANVRWKEWSVCEDGETQVDSIIIADCDEYYKYPGEPNKDNE